MKVGYSIIDITPPIGIELCGYGCFLERKAENVLDLLYARAVNLNDGNKKLLLINCDLVALTESITRKVKKMLSDNFKIAEECIMLLSTHTHTGPCPGKSMGIALGEPDEKYISLLTELLYEAGRTAVLNTREVKQARQFVRAIEPIGYNRADPQGSVDNSLHGIAFYFKEGKPLALVSHGCHPVTLGASTQISADYPGRVVRALSNKGFDGVFLTGFCGDIDPVSNLKKWGSGTSEVIDGYGERIANAFTEWVEKADPMDNMNLDAFEIPISLELQCLKDDEIEKILKQSGKGKVDISPDQGLL